MLLKYRNILGKPTSITRIFLICFLAIVIDQGMESVLLEAIAPFDLKGHISNIFLAVSIPFAVFLASLSDFHCRRKVMIFALTSLLLSGIFIFYFHEHGSHWIAYVALACKGIGGNVTPIALASLATIIPSRKFTVSLAIAICAYSLGSWIPIYFRSFEDLALIAVILSFICCMIAIKWFKEEEFDKRKLENSGFSVNKFIRFAFSDVKLIALFCVVTPVILVFLGFIFSEISFYQLLLRGEVLIRDNFYSEFSLKMGLGYYFGTGILCVLQYKKFSNTRCLKLGIITAFSGLFLSLMLNLINFDNTLIRDFFTICFSIGFALLTPALFAMLSRISRLDEQGKIYGLLDSTDTLAILIATNYIKHSKSATYNSALLISSTILFVSGIFMLLFIRYFKKLVRVNEHQSNKTQLPQQKK